MGNQENLQQTNFEATYQGDILQSLKIKIVDDSGIYINGSYGLGRHSSKPKDEKTTVLHAGGMLTPRNYIEEAKPFDVDICSAQNKSVANHIVVGRHASFSIYNGEVYFSATIGQSKTPSRIEGNGTALLYSTKTDTTDTSFLIEKGIAYTLYLGKLSYSLQIADEGQAVCIDYIGEIDLAYANQEP